MGQPKRFLLIDDDNLDNRLTRMAISRFFGEMDIRIFNIPEKGLEYIEGEMQEDPVQSVLFLDINMPTMTGWEVLEHLSSQSLPEFLQIFMLSSSISAEDKKHAEDEPLVMGYIEKPLNETKLKELFVNP